MHVALTCVLVAGLMPYAWTAVAKALGGGYDNRDVRGWQSRLTGRAWRAHAAHLNSLEAFPFFGIGVLAALWRGAPGPTLDALALAFTAVRLGYGMAYLTDVAWLRSAFWLGGTACTVAIFWLAL
jgi:uncharacterized MAPEG superfamily protein